MLWRNNKKMVNNRPAALKRYFLLQKRLGKDTNMFQSMDKIIKGYLSENPPYARKMTLEEANVASPRTWYLPIHPVVNPNKPGKVRVVNDAAAKYQDESLNLNLRPGPDLLSCMVGVLLRFRNREVAIAADVEAMFHQVRVSLQDADSLRFFWNDNINENGPPEVYQMLVHIFGATDSPACANYALKRTARDNFKDFDPGTIETVLKNFYVDDLLKSINSVDTAVKLAKELIALLKRGGFRLTKFLSSHKEVLEALPQSEVSPSATLQLDVEKLERALGISWDTLNDVFTFVEKLKKNPPSKLGILSTASSLFDPLGFLIPFLLVARLLLQDLWRLGYDWHTEIEGKLLEVWMRWLEGVKLVPNIRLPRRYITKDEPVLSIQLHLFCDASESAYGCVAYLRFTLKSGLHECSFVMSKSRLAPLKTITLPRLELNAALTGARLSRLIVHEIDLPIEKVFYWSDSTIVLQYIHNKKKRVKVFVANRVTEILELSDSRQWHHVAGTKNPADVLSRGVVDPRKLLEGDWFKGPTMLYEDEHTWESIVVGELDDDDREVKKKSVVSTFISVITADTLKVQNFSNWIRLKRIAAWMVRWFNNARAGKGQRSGPGDLQLDELNAGELVLIREAQQDFDAEVQLIKDGKELLESSKLIALSPFIDGMGILRVGGRLHYIPIPNEAKYPAILPRDHHVTRLLIEWLHRKNGHVGCEHVLSLLKERYWVLSARVAIKTSIRLCFFCRIRRAKRQFPKMANLPTGRAAIEEPPYTHCGVDLTGPLLIKEGRKRLKRWIVLFTCITVRCVHIEVVESSETDAFINSLRRFTNRRGCPKVMYSDNGTNFRGATAELKEFITNLDQAAINSFAAGLGINWKFNPPKAPHMGGIWERMIRSVKEVLTGILKEHILTDPQLYTALTEVENIVNSRPLTHVSDDVADLEALTPNHLLLGKHLNWGAIINTDDSSVFSRRKWKQVQGLRAIFWERWRKEYLPTLTRRSRWRKKVRNIEVGELVLIRDDDHLKRGKWPLARITKVMPGRDNIVRVVELKTKDGTYTRPVSSLYQLEDNLTEMQDAD